MKKAQARLAYGKEFAEIVLNICGNVISGQVAGDSAKWLSERFGKTSQDRESITFSSGDTNISQSRHLEFSIPVSRISSLSSGEFVGMVADNPDEPIQLKAFCCRIRHDV